MKNADGLVDAGRDEDNCGIDWNDVAQAMSTWGWLRTAVGLPANIEIAAATFGLSMAGIRKNLPSEDDGAFFWINADGSFEWDGL